MNRLITGTRRPAGDITNFNLGQESISPQCNPLKLEAAVARRKIKNSLIPEYLQCNSNSDPTLHQSAMSEGHVTTIFNTWVQR